MSVSSGSVGGRGHQNVNSNSDFRDSSPVASCRSMNIIDECRCVIEFLWQMPWASGISSNRGNAINFRAIRSQAGWICYSSRLTSGGGCRVWRSTGIMCSWRLAPVMSGRAATFWTKSNCRPRHTSVSYSSPGDKKWTPGLMSWQFLLTISKQLGEVDDDDLLAIKGH